MTQAESNRASPSPESLASVPTLPDAARVYVLFSALTMLAQERFDGELGGRLLLYGPLDAEGAAVALAGNIAGAATLGVDRDGERLKLGVRQGFCDFLVNNLDEALRILKNEVRKRQPVSVCLAGEFRIVLQEIVERGVQPDLLALSGGQAETDLLVERGAMRLEERDAAADPCLIEVRWSAQAAASLWLPKVDALAAGVLPAGDSRLRWLKFAPRYLGRSMAGRRYLRMTAEESGRFSALVAEAVASGAIGTEITIQG